MSLTGKDRAGFRAEAHHLDPLVHVGQHGLTPALVRSLDDALRTRELVKISVSRTAPERAKELAPQLAQRTQSEVIQVIGRTLTLFRHNPALVRREGDLPPWRR
ncbi:MAG TPA: ribosome assembly RNA-binding protein YhbY [Gemmatimonadaceae bacterium]|nr:ribosome assembly RNA-binding protein YhbY [Gemmatimonadaceae bacterium]